MTDMQGQISFDPQPSFFRNQRQMPLVSLATKQDVLVSKFGAIINDGKDDLSSLQAAFDAAKKLSSASNPVRVVFEKGVYDIMPTGTQNQSLFVTNANNIVFEGKGSEIRNHNPVIGFVYVNSCNNIIFKDLIFDYAILPFTQGKVTEVDVANNSFTIQIDAGFPLLSESHFTSAQSWGCLKDATGKLKSGANNLFPHKGWTQISGNLFKVKTPNKMYTSQVELGDYFVEIARYNSKTIFYTVSSKNVTFLNINIYAAPAGSFGGQENYELNIVNCKVIPKPGSGRVHSGNADIIHISGSFFGPWVQGCRFEAFTDDAVNLKHSSRAILEVVSPTVIKVKYNVRQTDKLVIFSPRAGMPIATPNAITNVVNLGNNIFEVTFDGNHNVTVVGEQQTADKVYFTNIASESAVFRNNVIKNGRRFGILFQSSYAQVKDCTFENLSSSGIKIENHVDWGEGYIANNIEIINNSFVNCGFDSTYIGDPNSAAISALVSKLKSPCAGDVWCDTEPSLWQGFENVIIKDNYILYNKSAINVQNLNGALITRNTYKHNKNDKTLASNEQSKDVTTFNCSNVQFEELKIKSKEKK
jgi:hypothetical protein